MNKRVYNSTVGKIFRTLGFFLVLLGSLYFLILLVAENQALPFIGTIIYPVVEPFYNMATGLPTFFYEYIGLAFIVGLFFLVWVLRRGIILRVLVSVGLIYTFFYGGLFNTMALAPIVFAFPAWVGKVNQLLEPFFTLLTDISEYVQPGIMVLTPVFLWMLFASKKPKRASVSFLGFGMTLLFLAILAIQANNLWLNLTADWFFIVAVSIFILAYALISIGSVFGLLGFSRK